MRAACEYTHLSSNNAIGCFSYDLNAYRIRCYVREFANIYTILEEFLKEIGSVGFYFASAHIICIILGHFDWSFTWGMLNIVEDIKLGNRKGYFDFFGAFA